VDKTSVFSLADVREWGDGYVGIGQVGDSADQSSTALA
jgi:hypothetical protein